MVKISEIKGLSTRFLRPDHVKTGDVLEFVSEGEYVPKEESQFGRDLFQIDVRLPDGTVKTWTMNLTTRNRMVEAYGDDTKNWVGKKVRVEVANQNVRGTMRKVIYGFPAAAEDETAKLRKFVTEELRPIFPEKVDMETFERLIQRVRGFKVSGTEAAKICGLRVAKEGDGKDYVYLK
jgi:hypothetical protein